MSAYLQVVEPDYVRHSWVEKRLNAWMEECLKAETAATIEKLIKVLRGILPFTDHSYGLFIG